jgi:hypothetical protein
MTSRRALERRVARQATSVTDIPQIYVEAWGAYESFRKLGFSDDEVETAYGPCGNPVTGESAEQLQVRVVAQGKRFVYVVGPVDEGFERCRAIIYELKRRIADGEIKDEALVAMWRSTELGSNADWFAMLSVKLKEKGFFLPALTN